jgi:hypothetical protein
MEKPLPEEPWSIYIYILYRPWFFGQVDHGSSGRGFSKRRVLVAPYIDQPIENGCKQTQIYI